MTDPLIGKNLKDAYLIEQQLAEGGMGFVYLAKQLSLDRQVVLKILRPSFYDQAFIDLFLREARINSQINHPNIVSVFDFGTAEDNIVFLAMEYLDGQVLGDIIAETGPFNLARIVWLMEQICNGLHAAHQLNIVHRDLKPNNVMVANLSGDTTVAKVLDFGISKPLDEKDLEHTQMGMVMGTPGYLAPEQIDGGELDARADIYALGALLFYMATGKRPFNGVSREIIMRQQLSGETPELTTENCPHQDCLSLNPVIKKALALDKHQRYNDVKSLWQAILDHAQAHHKLQRGDTEPSPTEVSNALRQVSFKGEVITNQDIAATKTKLASALKLKANQVDVLFSGKRIIVRKNLSEKDANRFVKLFQAAGAIAYSEPQINTKNPTTVTDKNTSLAPSLPSAGLVQPVTLTSIQGQPKTDTRIAPSPTTVGRTKKKPVLAVIGVALCLALISGVYFYPPLKYPAQDFWMSTTENYKPPQGISSKEIRIGMSAAFSGSAKELGRSMKLGVEAYFKTLNDHGGIHGRQLKLIAHDDGYEPQKAINNLPVFFNNDSGVFALLGNVGTPTANVILPAAFEEKMLVFGTFSGAQLLRQDPPDRYVFNYRASYAEETAAIIHYFVKVKKITADKIAVFYQNDGYGRDGLSGVVSALNHYDIDASAIIKSTYERNSTNIQTGIQHFVPHLENIGAIVIIGTYATSAEFTRAMRKIGFDGDFANVSFVGTHALAETLTEYNANIEQGILVTQTVPIYNSHASLVISYREALEHYFPEASPDFVSLEGYIVAKLFCESLKRAGRYFNTETLINSLENMTDFDIGIGSPLSFSKSDHQASHRVWGTRINSDGVVEAIDLKHQSIEAIE